VGECSFWYRPTWVIPDQRPLNGRCCYCRCHVLFDCQSEDQANEIISINAELESLRTQLSAERSERGKMESDMTQQTAALSTASEDLSAVRKDLKRAVDNISTKDHVISDLKEQMALLQHEVWYSYQYRMTQNRAHFR